MPKNSQQRGKKRKPMPQTTGRADSKRSSNCSASPSQPHLLLRDCLGDDFVLDESALDDYVQKSIQAVLADEPRTLNSGISLADVVDDSAMVRSASAKATKAQLVPDVPQKEVRQWKR